MLRYAKSVNHPSIFKFFRRNFCHFFVVSNFLLTFATALRSPDGGIGRRAGLKHQWGNPCRFDPGSGYKA